MFYPTANLNASNESHAVEGVTLISQEQSEVKIVLKDNDKSCKWDFELQVSFEFLFLSL